ncbi:MAG: hypothetical protein WBD40_16425 [Tepidisphaeraceae bacterium]
MFEWLRSNRLNRLEALLLDSLIGKLPREAADLLRLQISDINKIQRIVRGTEVDFFAMKRGRVAWEESHLFPCRQERKLATATVFSHEVQLRLKAELWIVDGHIFSIQFGAEPEVWAGSEPLEVEDLQVLVDPMSVDC